jgi:hypothetical protein
MPLISKVNLDAQEMLNAGLPVDIFVLFVFVLWSCVPNTASVSGLSILDLLFDFLCE